MAGVALGRWTHITRQVTITTTPSNHLGQVTAAKENASCVDPTDLQPTAIQCGALSPMCSTRLQIANNCSLNIGVRIYGVLATAMPPDYCVNNNTRPGEACLTAAYAYPAGTANTGGSYIFEGLSSAGMYLYAG